MGCIPSRRVVVRQDEFKPENKPLATGKEINSSPSKHTEDTYYTPEDSLKKSAVNGNGVIGDIHKPNGVSHPPDSAAPVNTLSPVEVQPKVTIQEVKFSETKPFGSPNVQRMSLNDSKSFKLDRANAEQKRSISLVPLPAKVVANSLSTPATSSAINLQAIGVQSHRRLKPMPFRMVQAERQADILEEDSEGLEAMIQEWIANISLGPLNLTGVCYNTEKPMLMWRGVKNARNGNWGSLLRFVTNNSRPLALNLSKNGIRNEGEGGSVSVIMEMSMCTSLTDLDLRGNELTSDESRQLARNFCSRCVGDHTVGYRDHSATNTARDDSTPAGSVRDASHREPFREPSVRDSVRESESGRHAPRSGPRKPVLTLCGISVTTCFERNLTRMNLYNESLGPSEAAMLAEIFVRAPCGAWLSCLDLNRNNLGSEGCRALGSCLSVLQALEILQMGINDIGDAGCAHLAPLLGCMIKLKALYLYQNNISSEGCAALMGAVPNMSSLQQLYLSHNPIEDEGYSALAATFGVVKWTGLGLRNVGLETDVITTIDHSPLLPNLLFLDLMENRVDSSSAAALELTGKAQRNAKILLPSIPSPESTPMNHHHRYSEFRAAVGAPPPLAAAAGGQPAPAAAAVPAEGAGPVMPRTSSSSYRRSSLRPGGGGGDDSTSLGAHLWADTAATALPRYIQSKP